MKDGEVIYAFSAILLKFVDIKYVISQFLSTLERAQRSVGGFNNPSAVIHPLSPIPFCLQSKFSPPVLPLADPNHSRVFPPLALTPVPLNQEIPKSFTDRAKIQLLDRIQKLTQDESSVPLLNNTYLATEDWKNQKLVEFERDSKTCEQDFEAKLNQLNAERDQRISSLQEEFWKMLEKNLMKREKEPSPI